MCVCSCDFLLVEAGWIIRCVAGQFVHLQNVMYLRRCASRVKCAWCVSSCVHACSRERVLCVRVWARGSEFVVSFSL